MSEKPEKKILLIGKGGQLSSALLALLGERAIAVGQDEADFMDRDFTAKIEAVKGETPISAVINASAYTQVDAAEGPAREQAFRINAAAVGELAAWCKKQRVPMVHFSTDYVFDGSDGKEWREDDPPHPINAYGQSKLEGERLLAESACEHLLIRTSWVYDATGKNFFTTMLRLFREKDSLSVVNDQTGAPTYAPHLAKATLAMLERAASGKLFATGIYHLCNGGETTWFGFARAIFEHELNRHPDLKCRIVNPVASADYPLPAARPINSRLDCHRARDTFGITMPEWEAGLKECFAAMDTIADVKIA